jgi:hypothetical protein
MTTACGGDEQSWAKAAGEPLQTARGSVHRASSQARMASQLWLPACEHQLFNAGPTVMPTIRAARTAVVYAATIGLKNAPGRPSSTATGRIASSAMMPA